MNDFNLTALLAALDERIKTKANFLENQLATFWSTIQNRPPTDEEYEQERNLTDALKRLEKYQRILDDLK